MLADTRFIAYNRRGTHRKTATQTGVRKSMAVKKKAAAKKTVAKKPAAKAAAPVAARKVKAITEPMSKTQVTASIAESTGLTKKQVTAVMEELTSIIEGHVKKRGAGQFTLPGLMKITTVKKPATKARKGINPFTGEETVFKAKPASTAVKIRPLKKLKDMAVS